MPEAIKETESILPVKRFAANEPWKPASLLHTVASRPGYVQKWVREDLLYSSMQEGYEPVKAKQSEVSPTVRLVDGTQLSNIIRKGSLILCEIPIETKKKRDAFFKELTQNQLKVPQEELSRATAYDGKTLAYGEAKLTTDKETKTNG